VLKFILSWIVRGRTYFFLQNKLLSVSVWEIRHRERKLGQKKLVRSLYQKGRTTKCCPTFMIKDMCSNVSLCEAASMTAIMKLNRSKHWTERGTNTLSQVLACIPLMDFFTSAITFGYFIFIFHWKSFHFISFSIYSNQKLLVSFLKRGKHFNIMKHIHFSL
jgi:hypothetical protein